MKQQKQVGRSPSVGTSEQHQELSKLQADLEKKSVCYEEELSRRELQHANELKNLKKELREAEGQQLTLKKEIMMLKDKLEKTRRERYWSYYKRLLTALCIILLDDSISKGQRVFRNGHVKLNCSHL